MVTQEQLEKDILSIDESKLDVYGKLDELYKLKIHSSPLPTKPRLKSVTPTDEEILKYSEDLTQYNKDLAVATESKIISTKLNRIIETAMESLIKDESGLNDIPVQYQIKVYSKAWCDSHSEGYRGVYNDLCDLVQIFK